MHHMLSKICPGKILSERKCAGFSMRTYVVKLGAHFCLPSDNNLMNVKCKREKTFSFISIFDDYILRHLVFCFINKMH